MAMLCNESTNVTSQQWTTLKKSSYNTCGHALFYDRIVIMSYRSATNSKTRSQANAAIAE